MDWNATTMDSMRRIFTEGFHARDIAEPLLSVDASMPAGETRQWLQQRGLRLVGVRRDGQVVGFVECDDLRRGHLRRDTSALRFTDRRYDPSSRSRAATDGDPTICSSAYLGAVGGLITRQDLEKPPVRMWLFGMITLLEMRTTRLIEIHLPNENWREALSASRIEKAEQLRDERKRRGQDVGLIDCLQITDKGQIIAKNADLRQPDPFRVAATGRAGDEDARELTQQPGPLPGYHLLRLGDHRRSESRPGPCHRRNRTRSPDLGSRRPAHADHTYLSLHSTLARMGMSDTNRIEISFLGGASSIGASCALVRVPGRIRRGLRRAVLRSQPVARSVAAE